jgi:hypothetical protein
MNSEGRKLGHCGKLDVDLVQEKRLRVGGTVFFHMLPNQSKIVAEHKIQEQTTYRNFLLKTTSENGRRRRPLAILLHSPSCSPTAATSDTIYYL